MLIKGTKWVYGDDDNSSLECVTGYIFLTIATVGLFIPFQLAWKGYNHTYNSDHSVCLQICGHIELTIVTLGIFLIVRFFQAICNNWNS